MLGNQNTDKDAIKKSLKMLFFAQDDLKNN